MINYFSRKPLPLEMHKICYVQKTQLQPVERRLAAAREAGFNSYRLTSNDVYLDMLTDSGVNAMTLCQLAAMMRADEAYAGSTTFSRLSAKLFDIFDKKYFLPAHQGRACEQILSRGLIKEGQLVPMNFEFGTTINQIKQVGGRHVSLLLDEGLVLQSDKPFKGNFDLKKLRHVLESERGNVAFVRIEAGTNLIGGQPISMDNIIEAAAICREYGVLTVLDASLYQDNLHFIRTREHPELSTRQITKLIAQAVDIIYFSARKLGFGKGGGILTNDESIFLKLEPLIARFEGFPTYGGISIRDMESLIDGLDDTMDDDTIAQGPNFIAYLAGELQKYGIPVVTPPGGLGCHIDARKFVPHVPLSEYPAGSLAAAIYISSGARGMERGGIDEPIENPNDPPFGARELVRLAMPRRVYTISQINYLIDRLSWLYENRDLIGGLYFEEGAPRNFYDRLNSIGDWPERLVKKFRIDFGESL